MISKEDFHDYLEDIKALEKRMAGEYARLTTLVRDPALNKTFQILAADESTHAAMIEQLEEIA